jgi:hypothetical protein
MVMAVVGTVFLSSAGCQYDGAVETEPDYLEHPPTEYKYKLIDRFGEPGEQGGIHYCDPLRYPELMPPDKALRLADEEMTQIYFDRDEYLAILGRLGLDPEQQFTDFDIVSIYREHHKLAAIALEFGTADYLFALGQYDKGQTNSGYIIYGMISVDGNIRITSTTLTNFGCPKK